MLLAIIPWLCYLECSLQLSAIVKQPCVYMFANRRNGTIYVGVTSNPPRRAFEHREGLVKRFSSKYGCKLRVWYELHDTMTDAIAREKQIKGGSRRRSSR